MANFIEEFFYENLDPQARSTKQNKAVQKQKEILINNEKKLTAALNDEKNACYTERALSNKSNGGNTMYIIKNAYKSIVRAKGRNLLIFVLVFLIAVSACVALSVRNSAEAAKETTSTAMNENFDGGFQGSGNNRFQGFGGANRPGATEEVEYLESLNATTDFTVIND